jgi:Homoserine dehydrogenase
LKQLNVGIVGLGTVGGGTYTVLKRNGEEMARRTGVDINVTHVADRNIERANELTRGDC